MIGRKILNLVAALLFLVVSAPLYSQQLPGIEVADSAVDQNAVTLVNLANQKFPELFSGGTPWRQLDGFSFKYFSATGIYLGVNDGNLFVLGGQFGNQATNLGKVTDIVATLSSDTGTGTGGVLFNDITSASTVKDLLRIFKTITVSYSTLSSFGNTEAAVSMEVQGSEAVNGVSAEKVVLTITGNTLSEPQVYQMWVDGEGVILRLASVNNNFEYAPTTANLIGTGLLSSMLLSLAAGDSSVVQNALSLELASSSVSSKAVDATISGLAVKTLALETAAGSSTNILFEISDFGAFSIMSKFESTIAGTSSLWELKNIVLR